MTDEARQFSYPHCNRILNIGVSVQYQKKNLCSALLVKDMIMIPMPNLANRRWSGIMSESGIMINDDNTEMNNGVLSFTLWEL